ASVASASARVGVGTDRSYLAGRPFLPGTRQSGWGGARPAVLRAPHRLAPSRTLPTLAGTTSRGPSPRAERESAATASLPHGARAGSSSPRCPRRSEGGDQQLLGRGDPVDRVGGGR